MGLFKQMKDMKTMVSAAPGLIDQAQQLQGAAQAQAQQLQAMAAGPSIAAGDARLTPISGVSLERYAEVVKALQVQQTRTTEDIARVVAAKGLDDATWQAAYEGWNARMQGDMALSTHFGHLYQASAG